jgi:hypothetical protein
MPSDGGFEAQVPRTMPAVPTPALSTTMQKVFWHEIELHCAAESFRIAVRPLPTMAPVN